MTTPSPKYIAVPASQAKWRLSQIHAAGVHTRATFVDGKAVLGPLSAAEYAQAWQALQQATKPADTVARLGSFGLILVLGAAMILFAPVVLPMVLALAGVVGIGALVVALMGIESIGMTRRARLARRHPDAGVRADARRTWLAPAVVWLLVALAVLALLAALAMAVML